MKETNALAIGLLIVGVIAIKWFQSHMNDQPKPAVHTPFGPMSDATAGLSAAQNVPITEAAYHQQPSDIVAAAGADENTPDEEVTF